MGLLRIECTLGSPSILRFWSFERTQVEVLDEARRLALNGNTLTDEFTSLATHIYRLFRP